MYNYIVKKKSLLFFFLIFSAIILLTYLLVSKTVMTADKVAYKSSLNLYFNGRYLTDKELSKLPEVKINFNNYDSLSHVFPQDGLESVYRLSHYYNYNSKFFRMEVDSSGKQWIHLSMDAKEYAQGHKHLKNYLRTQKFLSIENPFSYNFSFCFFTDKTNESVQIFHVFVYAPIKKSVFQIVCKNGLVTVKFPVELNEKSFDSEAIVLGAYSLGDVGKISVQSDGKTVLIYYNEKLVFDKDILPEITKNNAPFYIANGLYPAEGSQGFSEIFLSDIDYSGR